MKKQSILLSILLLIIATTSCSSDTNDVLEVASYKKPILTEVDSLYAEPTRFDLVADRCLSFYKEASEEEKKKLKNKLEEFYHNTVQDDKDIALKIRDLHKSLVAIHSEEKEIFSFMLSVQEPHAGKKKWDIHNGVPHQKAAQDTIIGMGSDIIKLAPESRHMKRQGISALGLNSLKKRLSSDFYKGILDSDYKVAFFWAHGEGEIIKPQERTQKQKTEIYNEFYELTEYLLNTYNETGKVFMIGNWEGDWLLTSMGYEDKGDATDSAIRSMIEWYTIRAKAIDDAKRNTDHSNVRVYHYIELNKVTNVLEHGVRRIVDSVLPYIKADFVSVSSYDIQGIGALKGRSEEEFRNRIFQSYDYIESNLPPRDIPGKRVFTGEVGFTIHHMEHLFNLYGIDAEKKQAKLTLETAVTNLEWGVDFFTIWALHNNELMGNGLFRGWGVYDQISGRKRILFEELVKFYKWANNYVEEHNLSSGNYPTNEAFRTNAIIQLKNQIAEL